MITSKGHWCNMVDATVYVSCMHLSDAQGKRSRYRKTSAVNTDMILNSRHAQNYFPLESSHLTTSTMIISIFSLTVKLIQ